MCGLAGHARIAACQSGRAEADRDTAHNQATEAAQALEEAEARAEQLAAQVAEREGAIAELREELRLAHEEHGELQTRLDGAEAQATKLRGELATREEAEATLRAELQRLQEASDAAHRETEVRNVEYGAQVQSAQALQRALEEEQQAVARLAARSEMLERQLAELTQDAQEDNLAALREHELQHLREEAASRAEAVADAEDARRRAEEDASQVQQALADRDESIRRLRADMARLEQQLSDAQREAVERPPRTVAPWDDGRAVHTGGQLVLLSELVAGGGRDPLGEILVRAGVVPRDELEDALAAQLAQETPKLLGTVLLERELATEEQIAQAVALQLHLPLVQPAGARDVTAFDLLTRDMCMWYVCLPLRASDERVVVAMANPLDHQALQQIAQSTGREVKPVVSTASQILAAIEEAYGIA